MKYSNPSARYEISSISGVIGHCAKKEEAFNSARNYFGCDEDIQIFDRMAKSGAPELWDVLKDRVELVRRKL